MCANYISREQDALLTTLHLADQNGMMGSMMQDLAFAIPGVDEAMSFAEIMKSVLSLPSPHPLSDHLNNQYILNTF